MQDLRDKVAVVTGGAGGVGRGLVEALLDEGAKVVIADIEAPVLEAAVAELSGRGEVWGVQCDIADTESVAALADAVFERYGTQPDTIFGPGGPVDADTTLISWSMAKSITHAAVGILVGDGVLRGVAQALCRRCRQ